MLPVSPVVIVSSVMGQFQVEPLESTVLKGSDARFSATVQGMWEVMTWNVRGFLVLTVPRIGHISSSSEQFSASFCSAEVTSCVVFNIHNASRSEAGPVICTVQGDYGSKSAQLHVQGTVDSRTSTICISLQIHFGGKLTVHMHDVF